MKKAVCWSYILNQFPARHAKITLMIPLVQEADMRYVRVKITAELKMAFRLHETDDEGDQQVSDQATRSKRKKSIAEI